jgi:molybdate transport system substrate-binding protein
MKKAQPTNSNPIGPSRPGAVVAPVTRRLIVLLLAAVSAVPSRAQDSRPPELLVFAAASLADALAELIENYSRRTGVPVRVSFAASSVLARQIESGGQAHLFVSADEEWMDYLAVRQLIDPRTRRDVVGNRLVLIAPADSRVRLSPAPGFALADALGTGRLAMADPDTVPAGRYARMALTSLGVWKSVEERLARAENVRAALSYVARGESPLGIVYATDAQIERKVRVVAPFPDHTHRRITYPAAATTGAGARATAFLDFLGGREAQAIWRQHGFRELIR